MRHNTWENNEEKMRTRLGFSAYHMRCWLRLLRHSRSLLSYPLPISMLTPGGIDRNNRSFLTITVFIHSISFIRVGSTNIYYIFCLLSQILSRTKEVNLVFFYFLFSFLLSFQFIFLYSIFRTRVRVIGTRSCCHT